MDFQQTLCYLLIRYLVPIILASAVFLRQNLFSLFYLLLLFAGPILPTPNADNLLKGSNGFYLQVIIVVSSFINSAHVVFQIILAALTDYPVSIDYCSSRGELYNFFGLHRYNDLSIVNILRLGFLDLLVFLTSSLVYLYCRRIYSRPAPKDDPTSKRPRANSSGLVVSSPSTAAASPTNFPLSSTANIQHHATTATTNNAQRRLTFDSSPSHAESTQIYGSGQYLSGSRNVLDKARKRKLKRERANRLTYYSIELIFCLLLLSSGLFEPSLTSSIYFLYFLFIGTWFGFNRCFTLGYHYFRIFVAIYAACHFVCLFLYQFPLIKPLVAPGNILARLFGLVEFTTETCENAREFDFHSYHFVRFLHPFMVLGLYFVSVSLVRTVLISKKYLSKSNRDNDSNISDSGWPLHKYSIGFLSFFSADSAIPRASSSSPYFGNSECRQHHHYHPCHLQEHCQQQQQQHYQHPRFHEHQHTQHNSNNLSSDFFFVDSLFLHDYPNQFTSGGGVSSLYSGYGAFDNAYNTADKPVKGSLKLSSLFYNVAFDPFVFGAGLESPTTGQSPEFTDCQPTSRTPLLQGVNRTYETETSPINTINNHFRNQIAGGSGGSQGASGSGPQTPLDRPRSMYSKAASTNVGHNELSLFIRQIVDVIRRGSYVLTLIVMMTWSITYHSWLGLVFLVASCFIWMTPNSRQACLNCSPFIVVYALAMLLGQYVYSLNLTDEELPQTIGFISVSEIGFRKYFQYSYQSLFIKIFYTFFFWITLRQKSERRPTQAEDEQSPQYPAFFPGTISNPVGRPSSTFVPTDFGARPKSHAYQTMVILLQGALVKYWIWVVAAMLMVMSISGHRVVIYRIVYMALFLTFTIVLMLSFGFWRRFMYPFWLLVILYSMTVLLAIYTFQFHNFPKYYEEYLHIDKALQDDLGLVVYDEDPFILFKELLTPTFFIVITIIQVHFVHKDFLEFSNIEPANSDNEQPSSLGSSMNEDISISRLLKTSDRKRRLTLSKDDEVRLAIEADPDTEYDDDRKTNLSKAIESSKKSKSSFSEIMDILSKCYQRSMKYLNSFMSYVWRFSEIHILKLILLCTVIIAIKDISAMNVMFVFFTVFLMVFSKSEQLTCLLFAIWAGILILLKMLFQLNFAQAIEWHTNCTIDNSTTEIIDNRTYIGFLKVDDIFDYIFEYILLIIILVLRTVINLRQYQNNARLLPGTIFPDVNRLALDRGFVDFFKYILNFGFYKFGVELVLIALTISISNRGDIFTVFYCIWLVVLVSLNRSGIKRAWPYFVGFMGIILPVQYSACLGLPPGLCLHYPWQDLPRSQREWIFLPDFRYPLPKEKLYLDFLILFAACRQLIWFSKEAELESIAGSNVEAYKERNKPNVRDCFSFGVNSFDSAKATFFQYFFWVSLATLFMAGTLRTNLFGLGYVLGSFIFLWNGYEFYLQPVKVIFKSWKIIMAYSCFTMLIKSLLEIFVMTFLRGNLCWLVQVLGVTYYNQSILEPNERSLIKNCPSEESGLMWDAISFACLLIQKRIFCSNYFTHLVREIRAQNFLASRGAELIHQIQGKEVAEQENAEREVMEKIRQKMDRIKATQQKMFADKARSIKFHKQAVKSGGYYMFDDFESDSVDLNHGKERESKIPDPEGKEMRNMAKSKGFTAFCSKLFKGEDISDASLVSAETANLGESSHESAIISVERSRYDPDRSLPTMTTSTGTKPSSGPTLSSLPSTSKAPALLPDKTKQPTQDNAGALEPGTDEPEPEEHNETVLQKAKGWFEFVKTFFESILISLTSSLNSVSRDYRFVHKRLTTEKKCLKKVLEFEDTQHSEHDLISDQIWRKSTLSKLSHVTEDMLKSLVEAPPEIAVKQWQELKTETAESDYYLQVDTQPPDQTSIYLLFIRSINYAILSRSEIMCYITIVLNQITTASIISLPLPLAAFLWGSLSVPRPSKKFWVSCITYIEVVVVIKYVFQFKFWPWLDGSVKLSPFWWPRIVGIEPKDNYANWDLVILLALFFHRFMLKSLGLWDLSETEMQAFMAHAELIRSDSSESDSKTGKRPSKTKKKATKSSSSKSDKGPSDERKLLEDGGGGGDEFIEDPSPKRPTQLAIDAGLDAVDLLERPDDIQRIENDNPDDDDEDDYEEEAEFNIFYFLMNLPTRLTHYGKQTWMPIYSFFHSVLHPPYRITRDVYSLMFLCDFINFFILVFGFYAFGTGYSDSTADVSSFLTENRIPAGFLITLLIQFGQIIIDRALYLRKNLVWKLIFQIFSVIFIHIWLFFILPIMTDKSFTDRSNLPPKLWYIFKCIYFLLSAFQIRSGYPTRILGNTFCKKYNFVNWYLFKMYMVIPFLYDLRMYMDWIWTDTSLVLDEWSLMEDIFVNLYQRKCELRLDEEFPEPRGTAKKRFFKYLIGGSWVVLIIVLIWGPLGLFAFGKAVGETNPPIGATIELEIGGFQSLFKMSVTGDSVREISEPQWAQLDKSFVKNAVAQTFITGYDRSDVYIVNLNGNSTAVWGISPPSQKILIDDLRSNKSLAMKITYSIVRKKQTKTQDMDTTIYDEHVLELNPNSDRKLREKLALMISDPENVTSMALVQGIFPNYLRVPEKGKPMYIQELLPRVAGSPPDRLRNFRNVLIQMKQDSFENYSQSSWWEIHDDCTNTTYLDDFMDYLLQQDHCKFLPIVLFNDKVFIGLLAFLSGYGIIGIYTTFVFLVSRFVRGLNSESSFKVIYTRMPNVDRVLQLCLDIYLVRESREFELEEDLYAKLIFLYRSPETLIKWTKINEEIAGEDIPRLHRHSQIRQRFQPQPQQPPTSTQ